MSAKKCLFGGALFAAGLASHAVAQDFNFQVNYGGAYPTSFGYAVAYGSFGYDYATFDSYDPNAATFDLSAAYGGSQARATLAASFMAASASSASGGYAAGGSYAYVTFDPGEFLRIVWDFSNEDPNFSPFSSDILIINWTTVAIEFAIDPSGSPTDPTSGDVIFAPTPGHFYAIRLEAWAFNGGSTSARIDVIPAPGALALAGLGGLVAVRRRR